MTVGSRPIWWWLVAAWGLAGTVLACGATSKLKASRADDEASFTGGDGAGGGDGSGGDGGPSSSGDGGSGFGGREGVSGPSTTVSTTSSTSVGGMAGMGAVGGMGGTGMMEPLGQSIYTIDGWSTLAEDSFFDHPWPSDTRRAQDGTIVLEGFPNPFDLELIDDYLGALDGRLHGFSPVAAGYLRFTVPLDVSTLPASVPESVAANSSVKLIDTSAELGALHPVAVKFRAEAGAYLPSNVLSFAAAFGQPLLPNNSYVLVVDHSVRDTAGRPLEPDPELAELMRAGGLDQNDVAHALALNDIDLEQVVHLTMFTTSDPTREAFALRDATRQVAPEPAVDPDSWSAHEQASGLYDVYEGSYGPSPDYQTGTPPFETVADGGFISYDGQGLPIVQREFDLRFALAVPDASNCPEPAAGYPVVLVAHGTGGNYRSPIGPSVEAGMFAAECLATLSIDQIFHGERPGNDFPSADLLYFNLRNPLAARTNGAQSAIDFVQLARLVTQQRLSVPASVSRPGPAIELDPDRVLFFGHSQGGLNGPLFLAMDDQVRGGVMSAAAAILTIGLQDKRAPLDFSVLVPGLLGLDPFMQNEFDDFHPALSLAQLIGDPSDGIHYARHIVDHPRSGFAAKSVFMTEGVRFDGSGDSYAPPRGIEALAAAVGLPTRSPTRHDSPFASWLGLAPLMVPAGGLSGNLAGGQASGALAQYDPDLAADGHFVAYQVPAARADIVAFLRALADAPAGAVPGG